MSNPIITPAVDYGKSTLFRFLDIKDIALITKPTTDSGAIKPKEEVFTGITSVDEPTTLLATVSEIRGLNLELSAFASWVSANANNLSPIAIVNAAYGVTPLTLAAEITLWENAYFQQKKGMNKFVSDGIVQLIRGNTFLTEFNLLSAAEQNTDLFASEELAHRFKLISQAVISIPKIYTTDAQPLSNPKASLLSPEQKTALKNRQQFALATYRNKFLTDTKNKFIEAERDYVRAKSDAYTIAFNEHRETVLSILTADDTDPETPSPVLPKFDFTFPDFDNDYLGNHPCYLFLYDVVKTLKEKSTFCGDFKKFIPFIESAIANNSSTLNDIQIERSEKTVAFENFTIGINGDPLNNSYVLQLVKLLPTHTSLSIVLTHFSKSENTKAIAVVDRNVDEGSVPLIPCKKIQSVGSLYSSFVLYENAIGGRLPFELEGSIIDEENNILAVIKKDISKSFFYYGPEIANQNLIGTPMFSLVNPSTDGELGNPYFTHYGLRKIGIGDYMRVEQSTCCYLPGEVSHIENIMAREYRSKIARLKLVEEKTTEESEEKENESTRDVSSTERYDMHREISQILNKEQSQQISVGAGFNASYKMGETAQIGVTANTNMNFNNSSSSTDSFSTAESFAREITQKATDRILQKVSYKRMTKMLREYEETNEHGFDNRAGSQHVVGIYRWIDKIYKNQLFNYGKRLMYEIMVPEPSKNFKIWAGQQTPSGRAEPQPPITPSQILFGDETVAFIKGHITVDNYTKLAGAYGADVKPRPQQDIRLGLGMSEVPKEVENKDENDTHGAYTKELEIPEGYATTGGNIHCKVTRNNYTGETDANWAHIHFSIGNFYISKDMTERTLKEGTLDTTSFYLEPFINKLPISVSCFKITNFSLNVSIHCWLTPAAELQWQEVTYMAIMDAYNKKYQAYLDAKESYDSEKASIAKPATEFNYNPGKGRAIEQREIKRTCIDMMFGNSFGGMVYKFARDNRFMHTSFSNNGNTGQGYQTPVLEQNLDALAWFVRFFEQVFEWNIMSYEFFPYYYGEGQNWVELLKQKSPADPLFEAFLQSGMAKITLTVRPGYEKQALYFFDTGLVPFNDNFMSETAVDLYNSITALLIVKSDDEQLEEVPSLVKTWETRVPTDLVILQEDAAPLVGEGLPCKCPTSKFGDGIAIGKSKLGVYSGQNGELVVAIRDALTQIIEQVGVVLKDLIGRKDEANPPTITCAYYDKELTIIQNQFNEQIANYDAAPDKTIVCQQTVSKLQSFVGNLNLLITNATGLSCDTTAMQAQLTTITTSLTSIEALCNP